MLLGVAGGCSAISKQAPGPLIAECALLRRKRTTELADRVPSLMRSSPKPTNRKPRCARRSDDTDARTGSPRKEPIRKRQRRCSRQTAWGDGGNPSMRFSARSKRQNVSEPRRSSVERDKERDGFVHRRLEEEGRRHCSWRSPDDQIGAGIPISFTVRKKKPARHPKMLCRLSCASLPMPCLVGRRPSPHVRSRWPTTYEDYQPCGPLSTELVGSRVVGALEL
jgi:hypothetical protein